MAASTRSYAESMNLTSVDCEALPLFHDGKGSSPTKAGLVSTYEYLALQCGLQLCSPEGARLFGGHSTGVAGAQALAAAGAEVSEIRIFARHSGDAIIRYVAEAPLLSLRRELGRSTVASKGRSADSILLKTLESRLQLLADQVEAQNVTIDALSKFSGEQRVIAYVQNCLTLAIHGQRAGDSSSTMCGMKVGPARVKRGAVRFLNTIAGESWELMCERCLKPERVAAIALEQRSIARLPDSSSKELLDA